MGNFDEVPDLVDLSSSSDDADEGESQYEEMGSYLYVTFSALGNVTSSVFHQWVHTQDDRGEISSNFSHPWLRGERLTVEDITDIRARCATALAWRQVNQDIRRRRNGPVLGGR
jgi:hypothetical protein